MRFMLRIEIPVDTGNEKAREGTMGETMAQILEEQKPESAYFIDSNGERFAILFVNIEKNSDIPRICEPWFLAFDAAIEVHPAMTMEDLAEAGPAIGAAVEKYA